LGIKLDQISNLNQSVHLFFLLNWNSCSCVQQTLGLLFDFKLMESRLAKVVLLDGSQLDFVVTVVYLDFFIFSWNIVLKGDISPNTSNLAWIVNVRFSRIDFFLFGFKWERILWLIVHRLNVRTFESFYKHFYLILFKFLRFAEVTRIGYKMTKKY